jgi:hypothetical protein
LIAGASTLWQRDATRTAAGRRGWHEFTSAIAIG